MQKVKTGLIQMKVVDDKERNIKRAEKMIKRLADRGVRLVILPEMFNCPYRTDKFPEYAEKEGDYTWRHLSRIAGEQQVLLVGGSIPERWGNKIYNTSYIFNERGQQIGKYRKMHLFDIDIEGGQTFSESDILSRGNDVCVLRTEYGRIGIIICYDLRFPELARILVDRGVEIIIVPGAFNKTTGPAHWEILFRTRAVDNQVYMLGAAPARNRESSYLSYGNSLIVNPWGKVLDRLGTEEGLLIQELDPGKLKEIREQLPLLHHRRHDFYTLQEKGKGVRTSE